MFTHQSCREGEGEVWCIKPLNKPTNGAGARYVTSGFGEPFIGGFKSKDIQKRSVSVSGGGEAFHLLPLGVLRASQLAMTIDDHATLATV